MTKAQNFENVFTRCRRIALKAVDNPQMAFTSLNHYLDLRTYKRNRSVIIVKITEEDLMVIENGFFKDRFQIKAAKLRKLLKSLLKKEFPRSRKIRLYAKGEFNEDGASG